VLLDAHDGKLLQGFNLGHGKWVPSQFPHSAVATRDGSGGWISLWNGSAVAELDLRSGKVVRVIRLRTPKSKTDASSHPTAMLLSPDEKHLYVTLSNRDEVAVLAVPGGSIERYLDTRLPGQTFGGSYPNALAQSSDGKTLYVANASSDAVAVFDLPGNQPTAAYFIPTEWYPTALAVHGDELLIASGKGHGTVPNAGMEPSPTVPNTQHHPYIASLIHGSIARVKLPEAEQQRARLTADVVQSNKMAGRTGEIAFHGGKNPIHHVIYVIKENRTYDQIFGDIREANGDPSLVMYGEDITPNQHKLARQFGGHGRSAIVEMRGRMTPKVLSAIRTRWGRESPMSTSPGPDFCGVTWRATISPTGTTANSSQLGGARIWRSLILPRRQGHRVRDTRSVP
jgi:YVTN family beta-propeller protein